MDKQVKIVAQKPRLGRGLSSLIGSTTATYGLAEGQVQGTSPALADASGSEAKAPINVPVVPPAPQGKPREIPVGEIAPNPYQPRREFRPQDLAELSESITQQGVIQPLVVVVSEAADSDAKYVLIAGERQLQAARMAGLATVPCVVRHATKQQMLEWALVENIQRADLNPMERAQAYREYMDRFSLGQADAAAKLGEPRTTIANHLRLLELSDEIQQLVGGGSLSFGHAKVLCSVADPAARQILASKVVAEGLSVRQLEGMISVLQAPKERGSVPAASKASRSKPPYIRDLEERLTQVVGTHVAIQPGRAKHTGRVVIDFYSLEDFDRISGSLGLRVDAET